MSEDRRRPKTSGEREDAFAGGNRFVTVMERGTAPGKLTASPKPDYGLYRSPMLGEHEFRKVLVQAFEVDLRADHLGLVAFATGDDSYATRQIADYVNQTPSGYTKAKEWKRFADKVKTALKKEFAYWHVPDEREPSRLLEGSVDLACGLRKTRGVKHPEIRLHVRIAVFPKPTADSPGFDFVQQFLNGIGEPCYGRIEEWYRRYLRRVLEQEGVRLPSNEQLAAWPLDMLAEHMGVLARTLHERGATLTEQQASPLVDFAYADPAAREQAIERAGQAAKKSQGGKKVRLNIDLRAGLRDSLPDATESQVQAVRTLLAIEPSIEPSDLDKHLRCLEGLRVADRETGDALCKRVNALVGMTSATMQLDGASVKRLAVHRAARALQWRITVVGAGRVEGTRLPGITVVDE